MKSGVCDFANSVQAIEVGLSMQVGHHSAAGIVGSWNDRDWIGGDINTEL